jgi:hypothetical protein
MGQLVWNDLVWMALFPTGLDFVGMGNPEAHQQWLTVASKLGYQSPQRPDDVAMEGLILTGLTAPVFGLAGESGTVAAAGEGVAASSEGAAATTGASLATEGAELQAARQQLVQLLHMRELGLDAATGGFRAGEAQVGWDLESLLGTRLTRASVGDWIDPMSGTTFDAVGPVPTEFLDVESFAGAIDEHLATQAYDRVVVDLRGLSSGQVEAIDQYLGTLSPADSARLIIFR